MADEGGDVTVLGGDFDLLVDHGVAFRFWFLGFLARRWIRLQGNRIMTRQLSFEGTTPALNRAFRIAIV
jgi:hypothetical protein